MKLALELGPLLTFFLTYNWYGIFPATGVFMAATVISLIASWVLLKKVPIMPLVSGALVLVFGGLTLYLQDGTFIKIKVTIIYVLFATALGVGLHLGQPFLKTLLSEAIQLQDEGWRKLTIRWMFFFLFLAVLNEIVWRNFPEKVWVDFKVFGILPLTFLFMMTQLGLLQKYQIPQEVVDAAPPK
jgi:intracellular septation protein